MMAEGTQDAVERFKAIRREIEAFFEEWPIAAHPASELGHVKEELAALHDQLGRQLARLEREGSA